MQVSIPILRVGVQLRIDVSPSSPFDVSIPILRVGVQLLSVDDIVLLHEFQFPYCAWEFNIIPKVMIPDIIVSIPILRVGVQP